MGDGGSVMAGNEDTRRQNLSALLTNLHRDGPRSRAELTRLLGLNRSTVSALVGELTALGLAYETAPAESGGVGRPSPIVHADDTVSIIAVNPDLDAVTVALVGLGGIVHDRERVATQGVPTAREAVELARVAAERMRARAATTYRVVAVGAAVPGLVRVDDGTVVLAPHLGWRDEPFAAMLAEATGLPAVAANDANLALLAECSRGAGRGLRDVVYLNGSPSGIGGGVLVGGAPLVGTQGFGAELGHTLVERGGLACDCGRMGCLETEVHLSRLLAVLGRDAIDSDELDRLLTGPREPAVEAEVDRQIGVLVTALAGLVSVFNPERIVLGGFLGSLFDAHPERFLQGVPAASFAPLAARLTIERARLRSRVLLVGAAEAAFRRLLDDPAGASALAGASTPPAATTPAAASIPAAAPAAST
ncbi:ROK family protein [Herbiconiux sp. A18JL235]|uniref:ROK family protein n=1 Tax=Herbiconiux sp. A18JL235 TaxID=3152363 RepID=A0AB39BN04_9MICO